MPLKIYEMRKQISIAVFKEETDFVTTKRRKRNYTLARGLYVHFLRYYCGMSFPEIGNLITRDHTSVIYYVKTFFPRFIGAHKENKELFEKLRRDFIEQKLI